MSSRLPNVCIFTLSGFGEFQIVADMLYNTYQPSLDPADEQNLTANWIQLTNAEESPQGGTLVIYDSFGEVVMTETVGLKAGERRDYSTAEVSRNQYGLVEWIPTSEQAKFQLRNVRYYYDNPQGIENFVGAVAVEGVAPSGQLLSSPLDTAQASSIVEIANASDSDVRVELKAFLASGEKVYEIKPKIPAHGSWHWIADEHMAGAKGIVTVKSESRGSVVASVLQYGRTPTKGVQTVYAVPLKQALGRELRGTYNTFLGQDCRLLLVNTTVEEAAILLNVKDFDGSTLAEADRITIPAFGMLEYPLCDYVGRADSYGMVTVTPEKANSIVSHVLRMGTNDDYRFITPVRQ